MVKPITEWNEEDYLKAHIELWTRIREKVKAGYELNENWLLNIKREIIPAISQDAAIYANCYLCEYYKPCYRCPLYSITRGECKFYSELRESTDYTLVLILIDYIIATGQDRLYDIMRDRNVKQ